MVLKGLKWLNIEFYKGRVKKMKFFFLGEPSFLIFYFHFQKLISKHALNHAKIKRNFLLVPNAPPPTPIVEIN